MKQLLILLISISFLSAKTLGEEGLQNPKYPKVFLIGEYPEAFEKLSMEYSGLLVTTCDNDLDVAYQKWLHMLMAMQTYADDIQDIDIRGVKIWLKVFWAEDGKIDHIAYFLKPNSKNIDTEELTAFFSSFMRKYEFLASGAQKFSHYASAGFPVHLGR